MMEEKHLTNDVLLDYMENRAHPGAREHLSGCAECRAELEALKPVRLDLERLGNAGVRRKDSDLVYRIMGNLEQTSRKRTYRRRVPVWRWVAGAAAAAVAVLAILFSIQKPQPPPKDNTAVTPKVQVPKPAPEPPVPESTPEPKPAPKSAPKPDPKPAPKPEPKPVPKPELKPELKPAPDPKPAPKPDPVKPVKTEPKKNTEPEPVFVEIAKLEGTFERRQEERWSDVKEEGKIRWLSANALRSRSRVALLRLSDGSRLTLGPRSEVRLMSAEPLIVALDKGRVYCEIPPEKGRDFRVMTPDADVAVTGTRFSVRRNSDHTQVIVSDGEVAVSNALGKSRVPAGTGLIVRKSRKPATPQIVDADSMLAWSRAARAPERSLFRFDFENGKRPYPWTAGSVVTGPARGINRHCLKVDADSISADLSRVDQRHTLYRENLLVRIRFYATDGNEFWVQFFSRKHKDNFRYNLKKVSAGKWETFELPLSELYRLTDRSSKMSEGDKMTWLSLGVSGAKGPVYFDDIELVEVLSR